MNRHAETACDESDDFIARKGIAAAGHLDLAVVYAFHPHTRISLGMPVLFLRKIALYALQAHRLDDDSRVILAQTRHQFGDNNGSVAYRGIEIVYAVLVGLAYLLLHKFVELVVGQHKPGALHFPFEFRLAFLDILRPALVFEPRTDLGLGLAGLGHVEPVAAGTVGDLLGGLYLDFIAGVQHRVERNNSAVNLRADHAVSHLAVNRIGKVDHRRTSRQYLDLALGRKYIYFLRHDVFLDDINHIGAFAVHLVLDHLADPCHGVFKDLVAALGSLAGFVLPVGSHTEFSREMHIPGAYLHFKGNGVFIRVVALADDSGVQRLVAVGLGHGNVVLIAIGQRRIDGLHHTQRRITFGNGIHNHAHGIYVVNILKALALHDHLVVDAVNGFDTS